MWRLKLFDDDLGRTEWYYDENITTDADRKLAAEQKQIFADYDAAPNSDDKIYTHLALSTQSLTPSSSSLPPASQLSLQHTALAAALAGTRYYRRLQTLQGFWPGDYAGPMFQLPNMVICLYVTGQALCGAAAAQCLRYVRLHQNRDGGWGLHVQSEGSTLFGSSLNYVAARLLGACRDEPWLRRARAFLRLHGGPLQATPWAKFWLAVLGVYGWDGVNSLLPELWLLPEAAPVHPSRWWCHCRMVYLPMAPITERVFSFLGNAYERLHSTRLREKATAFLLEYIRAEDAQTDSICIGPVNKSFNMLCIWLADGPDSESFRKHLERARDYFWVAEDGMKLHVLALIIMAKFKGYNGSQLWDTAFAMMAISKTFRTTDEFKECFQSAYDYVDKTQGRHPVKDAEKFYRHDCVGGWPFSTKSHGWPISDCTSHALTAVLISHELDAVPVENRLSDERIFAAVKLIISYQNPDGGFPTYENQRGSALLELLNPSVTFDRIMVDYSYTELSGSATIALCHFRKMYPKHRTEERAVSFIKRDQRADGSWYGSWGICFTYAAFFAITALVTAGEPTDGHAVRRACRFLASKQKADGGWGETHESCSTKTYCQNEASQVVNTAWAVIALMAADYTDVQCVRRGVRLIAERQRADGGWAQEDISGVFNANSMITYTAYKNVFSIWALALFAEKYEHVDM